MLAPLLLVWPLSVGLTFLVAQGISNAPFDRGLSSEAQALASLLTEQRGDAAAALLPAAAYHLLRADEVDSIYFQVIDAKGQLLAGDRDLPAPPDGEVRSPGTVQFRDGRVRTSDVRIAYLWIAGRSPADPPALVQVAETLDKRTRLANEIIKGVILPQFVVLPVSVLLVWFGLTRGIAPLAELSKRLRQRRPDDLSPIDPREAPEEMAALVEGFNDMLGRMQNNMQAQRRFVADAAHQLKTPLAGLRMQAELALRESSPEEVARSLKQIARGSQQATRLANQLLALARAENTALALKPFGPVDLVALAREVIADWVPEALRLGHDLGFEAAEQEIFVSGSATLLGELIKNLVDNALRYTPAPGRVTVRVLAGATAVLEVEDTGIGIGPQERQRVLQPFYRVLSAPHSAQAVDGSGLGLSIVNEIARQHDAQLELRSPARGGGLLVRITFAEMLPANAVAEMSPGTTSDNTVRS